MLADPWRREGVSHVDAYLGAEGTSEAQALQQAHAHVLRKEQGASRKESHRK